MAAALLRVLCVEDLEDDCLLTIRTLERAGLSLEWRRVDTRAAYLAALANDTWDVVLSDHALPTFSSIEARRLLVELGLDLPFIIVSGTIGEEQAAESMRAGAHDYVLKGNLPRLVPAIMREVREAENRRRGHEAEAALKRSEEQLRHSQKMEAVGRLAGGVAHDFNNLLTAILGFSQLALDRVDDPTLRADLEQVIVNAERAARLTSQLLTFSRQKAETPKLLDLREVLAGLQPMLHCLVGEEVQLAVEHAPELGRIFMDRGQLEQIVMNLAVNARDAMPAGGRLMLSTRARPSALGESNALGFAVLEVRDSGTGMDAETRARVFEPFFTTKDSGRGTGLGLSMVYGILQQNGGLINLESQVGEGTIFFVHLPIAAAAEVPADQPAVPPARTAGSETILVVEDEPSVRTVLVAGLTSAGYRVIEAEDSAEAMAYGLDLREPLDLLVTDMAMPGIGGRELARQLVGARSGLRVLYVSGYGRAGAAPGFAIPDRAAFLQKPFGPSLLLAKVRERLDAPVGEAG